MTRISNLPTHCRLEVDDTAGWKPALPGQTRHVQFKSCEMTVLRFSSFQNPLGDCQADFEKRKISFSVRYPGAALRFAPGCNISPPSGLLVLLADARRCCGGGNPELGLGWLSIIIDLGGVFS